MAFSPDGKRVLTGSEDKTAKLWDAETGQEIRTFRFGGHTGRVLSVAFSPDGKHIATDGSLGAFLWDAETGALLRTFLGHSDLVTSVAFSPDGKRILTGSGYGTAQIWQL